MFFSVLLIVVILCIAFSIWSFQQKWKYQSLDIFPGPPAIPVFGNALQIAGNPIESLKYIMHVTKTYGPICKMWIGPNKPYLLVTDPDLLQIVLSSPKNNKKSIDYNFFIPWLGNGLLLSNGMYWFKRRKIITPTFHFKILKEFIPVFTSKCDILIEKLSKEVGNDVTEVYKYISLFSLDVICETAMGTAIHAQKSPKHEYIQAVRLITKLISTREFSTWKQFSFLYKFSDDYKNFTKCLEILHKFTNSVIQSRRIELENQDDTSATADEFGSKRRVAFLDLLLRATIDGQPLSDEDIREEVDTFMFEGHDTVSVQISLALYLIARSPEVQNKMVEELKHIFGDDTTRNPTMQDLNDMKYIDMVVKETLRIHPSVPYIGRELEEDIYYNGRVIPKGVSLFVIISSLHMRPDIFEDPEKFLPERFSTENLEKKNPYAYIPFSAGPRNCIGQKFAQYEIKATLSKILRRFELHPVDSKYDIILSGQGVLKPANGAFLQIRNRKF